MAPRLRSATVPAMGAQATVVSDAPGCSIESRLRDLDGLERLWSRFRDDSEISAVNPSAGPVIVSRPTAEILDLAVRGSELTDGWYDVTVGRHVVDIGYDRPFVRRFGPRRSADRAPPAGRDLWVDVDTGLVMAPTGRSVDLGGIGKGRAADMLVTALGRDGASIAAVTIGGDMRIRADRTCLVPLVDPLGDSQPAWLRLTDHGVAVSGPTRRRAADGRHHLIDPRTGTSAPNARISMVIAATAARAEVLATAAAIAPVDDAAAIVSAATATAWLIELDGSVRSVGRPGEVVVSAGWLHAAGALTP